MTALAPSAPVATVLSKIGRVHRSGSGWSARCPAHEDRVESLSVGVGRDGRALIKCHAGCERQAILRALDLTDQHLFPEADGGTRSRSISDAYDYVDEGGALLFQTVRYAPKSFSQRRSDGNGGWIWSIKGTRRVLYKLPTVLAAVKAGNRVFVVEGEKDVHALEAAGEVATTNPMGAGKWRDEYARYLTGADVVVVADRDDPGRRHARVVAASLEGAVRTVGLLEPPEPHKDVSELLSKGGTLDQLMALLANDEARPSTEPSEMERPRLNLLRAVDITPKAVSWLWRDRIARGMLNVLAGPQGVGKSTIIYDLASRVSRAGAPVLVATAEDSLESLVRPRLEVANADLDLVSIITGVGDRQLLLPVDEANLQSTALDIGAALITVDPIACFIESRVDTHKDASVRQALAPLARVAESTGAAVVVVLHTNKGQSEDPLFRIGGSGAFTAAARQVLLAAADPADESGNNRVLAVVKSNIAKFAPPLAYTIKDDHLTPETGEPVPTSRIAWGAEIPNFDVRALLRLSTAEERSAVDEACDFLREELASGPCDVQSIERAADKAGISKTGALKRAKANLGVKAEAVRGPGNTITNWLWRLPALESELLDPEEQAPRALLAPLGPTSGNRVDRGPEEQGEQGTRERTPSADFRWCPECGSRVHRSVGDSHRCPVGATA